MSYSTRADHFLRQMPRLVTLAPYAGHDQYGDESWGVAKTYHARIEAANAAAFATSGEVIVAKAKILMHPKATDDTVLTTLGAEPDNAKLTLPDGVSPRILSVGSVDDATGLVYWEILTG